MLSTLDLWGSVEIVEGASLRVGYQLTRNVIEGDGTFGDLVYDRYQDGQLYAAVRIAPFEVLR